jgi:hypothetical protein
LKTLSPNPARADACMAIRTQAQIDCLMIKAFYPGRPARSTPYRLGVRAILASRLASEPLPKLAFGLGSAELDAYFSGQDEGHAISRLEIKGGAV